MADLTGIEIIDDVDNYPCQSLDTTAEGRVVVLLMGMASSEA